VTSAGGYLAALWAHECGRVFCDKMVSEDDKAWVDRTIADLAKCAIQKKHRRFNAYVDHEKCNNNCSHGD
jgi:hypothetical protein